MQCPGAVLPPAGQVFFDIHYLDRWNIILLLFYLKQELNMIPHELMAYTVDLLKLFYR